jgi:hypothetical protein
MLLQWVRRSLVLMLFAAAVSCLAEGAAAQRHRVATWAASPQSARIVFPRFPSRKPLRARPRTCARSACGTQTADVSLRVQIRHLSMPS